MKKRSRIVLVLAVLALFTFALLGCGKSDDNQDATGEDNNQPSAVSAGDVANGKKIYQNNCLACHGKDGKDGHNGPNLQGNPDAKDATIVKNQIQNGGGGMPAFKDVLSEQDINDLVAYITQDVATK